MVRSFLARSLVLYAVLLAGAVVLLAGGGGTVAFAIGVGIIGVAAVLLVSLFFYEVGRSEDRARARERARRSRRSGGAGGA